MAVLNGFQLFQESVSISNILQRQFAVPSTQYFKNDALTVNAAGELAQVTATGNCYGVYVSMETPSPLLRPGTADLSTTNGERIAFIPAAGNGLLFRTFLIGNSVPFRNNVALSANSTLNTAVWVDAGSTGDILAGQAYFPTLNYQALILTDVVSAGSRTITFPTVIQSTFGQITLPRALTTGDTVIAVPWSKGAVAVQFNVTTPSQGLSNTVAGKTGGKIDIQDVFLSTQSGQMPYAVVSFPVYSTN